MKKKIILPVVLVLSLVTVLSCKSQFEQLLASADFQTKYRMAFELFEAKKYSKAASMFESMKMNVSGLPQEDTVNYYIALSHYKSGDMQTAEAAFQSFYTSFPRSSFTSVSRFLYLDCLYHQTYRYELDQMPTHKAMAAISEYMVDYPESEYIDRCREMMVEFTDRLERKAYEAAKIYYTTEDYKAAHYAFKDVLKDNAETQFREQIVYYIALSSYKYAENSIVARQKERFMTFIDEYYNFIGEYPESKYRRGLDILFKRAQGYLKKVDEGKLTRKEQRQAKKEAKKNDKMLKDTEL